ncbi:acyl-CoA dehydrogenase family protein [Chryseosolibacter indicus]|uniref:Acyl-CoA dehydrogenase family protein n=1 Tax=Chryseosolibacter indicus TaxID=2782351 RepID=A0ABS5VWY8_9BACT|nr:acyl-CoA dehydrogenase family protein [Chryseosolibacter indicus]MBT1705846.1 acyl-CoA dehydrogenase family protein [Chryseosolibacter indicus]
MVLEIEHPSAYLDKSLVTRIRNVAHEAERACRLQTDQLNIIYEQGWFKMYVPHEFGGLELSLPEILRIEESLAWVDGSTAWVVTLCSGAVWFIGFLDDTISNEYFHDKNVCLAGTGRATGIATITEHGYEVTGHWKYASGSFHATCFTANCLIYKDEKQVLNDDGSPLVRAFIFKKDEVNIVERWPAMGMLATTSHSFELKNVSVPANRSFIIDPLHAKLSQPVFRFPFMQLAETTLTVNLSGMALRFIDLCEDILNDENDKNLVKDKFKHSIESCKRRINDLRVLFFTSAEAGWQSIVAGDAIPAVILSEISEASHSLAQGSRQVINELYPYCGLAAADTTTEINRVWRNFHTAAQHALFRNNIS